MHKGSASYYIDAVPPGTTYYTAKFKKQEVSPTGTFEFSPYSNEGTITSIVISITNISTGNPKIFSYTSGVISGGNIQETLDNGTYDLVCTKATVRIDDKINRPAVGTFSPSQITISGGQKTCSRLNLVVAN